MAEMQKDLVISTSDIEKAGLPVILYAGTSERRQDALLHIFPKTNIVSQEGGVEDKTLCVIDQAKVKVIHVQSQGETTSMGLGNRYAVVSSDTMIIVQGPEGLQQMGKPATQDDTRQIFSSIYTASTSPSYTIVAGSFVSSHREGVLEGVAGIETATILLHSNSVAGYSTPEGFQDYLNAFQLDNDMPDIHGMALPKDITKGACGLDLGTLLVSGAIESIDNIPVGPTQEFRVALERALFISHAGFSSTVLTELAGTKFDLIKAAESWPWLLKYVENLMRTMQDKSDYQNGKDQTTLQENKEGRGTPLMSIVVPVKDDMSIKNLVDSLVANEGFDRVEVIIVRNAPTEEIIAITESMVAQHANIRIVDAPRVGIAYGRNRGIGVSQGDWIVHLDSDVVVSENFIVGLETAIAQNQQVDIIVPRLLREEGNSPIQRLAARHYARRSSAKKPLALNPGLVIHKNTHTNYGLFDERLHAAEDAEWRWRTQNAQIVQAPHVVVTHRADGARKLFTQHFRYGADKSRILHLSTKYDGKRVRRKKLSQAAILPTFVRHRKNGLIDASFEAALAAVGAAGFWSEEFKRTLRRA